MSWEQIQKYHKIAIALLLGSAIGAWGQSIENKLPQTLWKAERYEVVQPSLVKAQRKLKMTAAEAAKKDAELNYCRRLFPGVLW